MRKQMLATVAVAALIVFAQSATARPIDVTRNGCGLNAPITSGSYVRQDFKPTFSVLRKAKVVVYNYWTFGTADMRVDLYDGSGEFLASSSTEAVVEVTLADAQAGQTVVFSFGGGVAVTPGSAYQLRLLQVSGDGLPGICYALNTYPDGYLWFGINGYNTYDLEFAVSGGGKPK